MAHEMNFVNADKAGTIKLEDLPHVEGPAYYPDENSTAIDLINALRWACIKDYIQWLTDPDYNSAEQKHWPEMDRLSLALNDMAHGRSKCPCDKLSELDDTAFYNLIGVLFGKIVNEEPEERKESEDDLLELIKLLGVLSTSTEGE